MNRKLIYIIVAVIIIILIISGIIYYFQNKNYGYCEEFEADGELILVCDDEYIFETEVETDKVYVAKNNQFKVSKNEFKKYMRNSEKVYRATYDLDSTNSEEEEKDKKKSKNKGSKKGSSGKGS